MTNEQDMQMLRVVIFEENISEDDSLFIARCLEKNIGAQGRDINEALHRLAATLFLEAPYMDKIDPAPDKYFDMWDTPDAVQIPASLPVDARMVAA